MDAYTNFYPLAIRFLLFLLLLLFGRTLNVVHSYRLSSYPLWMLRTPEILNVCHLPKYQFSHNIFYSVWRIAKWRGSRVEGAGRWQKTINTYRPIHSKENSVKSDRVGEDEKMGTSGNRMLKNGNKYRTVKFSLEKENEIQYCEQSISVEICNSKIDAFRNNLLLNAWAVFYRALLRVKPKFREWKRVEKFNMCACHAA